MSFRGNRRGRRGQISQVTWPTTEDSAINFDWDAQVRFSCSYLKLICIWGHDYFLSLLSTLSFAINEAPFTLNLNAGLLVSTNIKIC